VADAAVRAGIPDSTPGLNLDNLDLTFVLGTASPSGLDMANAYATFAAEGVRADATSVVKQVTGANGGLLYEYAPSTSRAFDGDVANTVSYALNHVVDDGTGATARALGRPAAGKTGTTDDNKSAWFVGYTPQLAAAVLMAKETGDGTPVSMAGTGGLETVTGGSFPASIWTAFMKAALQGEPEVDFPAVPKAALRAMDCPSFSQAGVDVPLGCPTAPPVPEFGPDPTTTPTAAPTDAPTLPSDNPSGPVISNQTPGAPTPTPTTTPPAEPTEEARP
jgi:membrane peptidoglycan carboxypeptidase